MPAIIRLFLGGTFNPVHVGHARLLLECQQQLKADKAYFVPCAYPPHKSTPEVTVDDRLRMAELVAQELNSLCSTSDVFDVEPYELERKGPSYTLLTLIALRERYPNDKLIWVIGMDSLVNLHKWHKWQQLLDWANVLVVNRPEYSYPSTGEVADFLAHKLHEPEQLALSGGVSIINTTPLAISSSRIRQQLQQGLPPQYLLPEPVCAYIKQKQLYL